MPEHRSDPDQTASMEKSDPDQTSPRSSLIWAALLYAVFLMVKIRYKWNR